MKEALSVYSIYICVRLRNYEHKLFIWNHASSHSH